MKKKTLNSTNYFVGGGLLELSSKSISPLQHLNCSMVTELAIFSTNKIIRLIITSKITRIDPRAKHPSGVLRYGEILPLLGRILFESFRCIWVEYLSLYPLQTFAYSMKNLQIYSLYHFQTFLNHHCMNYLHSYHYHWYFQYH